MDPDNKKVLVAPLNWGLGHATRCIPLIRKLLQEGSEVVLAADGYPLSLLRQEFPQLAFIEFSGYDIHYPADGTMVLAMLRQIPRIIRRIRSEHRTLQKLIDQHGITKVISDNRYGLWSTKVPCIFITHQVMVKCPPGLRFMESMIYRLNCWFMKHYTACWIPDEAGAQNLSGDLSHKYPLPANAYFIGPQSRFEGMQTQAPEDAFPLVAIVSGPEPQRSLFEQKLLRELQTLPCRSLLVCGQPDREGFSEHGSVTLTGHLDAAALLTYINSAELVVSRTGYSTIMDLWSCRKKALLVPTPGQTEQEYLADYHHSQGLFETCTQDDDIAGRIKSMFEI